MINTKEQKDKDILKKGYRIGNLNNLKSRIKNPDTLEIVERQRKKILKSLAKKEE